MALLVIVEEFTTHKTFDGRYVCYQESHLFARSLQCCTFVETGAPAVGDFRIVDLAPGIACAVPRAVLGALAAQEAQLIQLFFGCFFTSCTMGTLAESPGPGTVDAAFVLLAPAFCDDVPDQHARVCRQRPGGPGCQVCDHRSV